MKLWEITRIDGEPAGAAALIWADDPDEAYWVLKDKAGKIGHMCVEVQQPERAGIESLAGVSTGGPAASAAWVVIVEDRHSDVDAVPFSTEAAAFAAARDAVPGDVSEEPLNEAMRRSGWVLYLPYGTEGDCVRVVKRTMDDAARLR